MTNEWLSIRSFFYAFIGSIIVVALIHLILSIHTNIIFEGALWVVVIYTALASIDHTLDSIYYALDPEYSKPTDYLHPME